jgi:chemotaxis protein methyltransferase CheR
LGTQNNPVATEHELGEIRALIERHSGILFEGSRERLFATRVGEHLSEKKMAHGSELLRAIRASNVEYEELLQRLLTQETSFFRYPDMFDALQKRVLPELHMRKLWTSPRSLRVWSAGCSTGEEPYSIAMAMVETLECPDGWELKVLATDISRTALQQAERGVYSPRQLAGLTPARLENHFTLVDGQYLVKPRIRNLLSFAPFNLVNQVYPGRFDCIFCMNVLIYFSEPQRTAIIERFQDYLEPGGFLFLGHAESLNGARVNFRTIVHRDARVYQKPERASTTESSAAIPAGRSTP